MKDLERKMFLGFIQVHVLHHADKEPIYGSYMLEELKSHGYEIGASHIYPLLARLKKEGFLASYVKLVSGKNRKYYTITEKGKSILKEAQKALKEMVKEVLT